MTEEIISAQCFCLEKYRNDFTNSANELRQNNILCDIVLKVQDSTFSAHRAILAAGSPFFRGLFTNEMKEKYYSEVTLSKLESSTFAEVLRFIYTGKAFVNQDNARELLSVADYFLMPSLKEMAEMFLENTIDSTNCFSLYAVAKKYSCNELEKTAKKYVCDHFLSSFTSEEFHKLDFTAVKDIVSSDEIFVYREEQVFEAVMKWINFDFENRKLYFDELFSEVRLFSMSKFYIKDYVESEDLVRQSEKCNKLMFEAMKCFAFPDYRREQLTNGHLKLRKWLEKEVNAIVFTGGTSVTGRIKNTDCYIPQLNLWYQLSDMEFEREEHMSVVLDNFLYSIGGYRENQTAERYDPRLDSWERIANLPSCCSSAGTATADGEIYVLGGSNGFQATNNTICYSPEKNSCSKKSPMLTARKGAATVVVEGYVYVFGGSNSEEGPLSSVESYDPGANLWRKEPPMLTCRVHAQAIVVNQKIYLIGGYQDDGISPLCSCEVYNPDSFQWSFLPSLHDRRAAAGVACIGGKIYVFGGNNDSGSLETVESLDTVKGKNSLQWNMETSIPKPRSWFQCNVLTLPREVLISKKRREKLK